MNVKKQYLEWWAGGDAGISSKTILYYLTGIPCSSKDIPHDIADVGRCVRMLRKFPELRERLGEVTNHNKQWMPFIDCWKKLETLYDECVKFESLPENEAKKLRKQKGFESPNDKAWDLIQKLKFASYYLSGMRCQNSPNSWSTKPPKTF